MQENVRKIIDETLISKVSVLKELVASQENSIVSRAIINKKVGTVTVFSFDKGQTISPHSAPYDAIVIGLEGKGLVTIAEDNFEINDGEMIIMPANITHSVNATEKFKMMIIMIKE